MIEETKKKPKVRKSEKVLFVGKGSFISGLPARSMSMREWNLYPKELRDKGFRLNLYKME